MTAKFVMQMSHVYKICHARSYEELIKAGAPVCTMLPIKKALNIAGLTTAVTDAWQLANVDCTMHMHGHEGASNGPHTGAYSDELTVAATPPELSQCAWSSLLPLLSFTEAEFELAGLLQSSVNGLQIKRRFWHQIAARNTQRQRWNAKLLFSSDERSSSWFCSYSNTAAAS